jgi:aldehyde:ferredoxin oxidoreductase
MEDPLPEGPAKGMVIERDTLEMMKDAYYEFRGWDKETGKPTPEKLRDLELDDLIEDMWGK